MSARNLLFLGTGSSLGVPVIGCMCKSCLSQDSRNRRSRAGALLTIGKKRFLIDASPDYREQALKHQITALDGCFLTHSHYDHMGGFDDLKVYAQGGKKLPIALLESTFQELRECYGYFIKPIAEDPRNSALFSWKVLAKPQGVFSFGEETWEYVTFWQMGMQVMGIRTGQFAYLSDIKDYDEAILSQLKGVDTLVISALRKTSSLMHLSLEEACALAKKIGATKTILTHISHELEHEELSKELPHGILVAYDGLEIEL